MADPYHLVTVVPYSPLFVALLPQSSLVVLLFFARQATLEECLGYVDLLVSCLWDGIIVISSKVYSNNASTAMFSVGAHHIWAIL